MPRQIDDGFGELGDQAADEVDAELTDVETRVLHRTAANIDALRPRVSDKAAFDKLVKVVNQSTQQNENVAALGERLREIGGEVAKVAKEVVKLVG